MDTMVTVVSIVEGLMPFSSPPNGTCPMLSLIFSILRKNVELTRYYRAIIFYPTLQLPFSDPSHGICALALKFANLANAQRYVELPVVI